MYKVTWLGSLLARKALIRDLISYINYFGIKNIFPLKNIERDHGRICLKTDRLKKHIISCYIFMINHFSNILKIEPNKPMEDKLKEFDLIWPNFIQFSLNQILNI